VRKRRHHLFSKPRQLKKKPGTQNENGSSPDAGNVEAGEDSTEMQASEAS
jgi:hypothetical protein